MAYDLLIRNGTVIDGTGAKRYKADVAIANGKVAEIGKVIVGHQDVIRKTLTALFSGGHVLIEGVPGLAKTLTLKTLAGAVGRRTAARSSGIHGCPRPLLVPYVPDGRPAGVKIGGGCPPTSILLGAVSPLVSLIAGSRRQGPALLP